MNTMITKYYTGVGSRKTPEKTFILMQQVAGYLGKLGYTLRTGGAVGADTAFESGCDWVEGKKEIWIPWNNYQGKSKGCHLPTQEHYNLASTLHPVWNRLSRGVRSLHARNTGQVLGVDLRTPSNFLVCWTPDGVDCIDKITSKTGGTSTALKLALLNNIPVVNMFNADWKEKLKAMIT